MNTRSVSVEVTEKSDKTREPIKIVLQTITNDFRAVRLLDLGSGSARGPFLVTQIGRCA